MAQRLKPVHGLRLDIKTRTTKTFHTTISGSDIKLLLGIPQNAEVSVDCVGEVVYITDDCPVHIKWTTNE